MSNGPHSRCHFSINENYKVHPMDKLILPTIAEELGNAARLLSSWLDGIFEFTILKHEVVILRLKN